MRAREREEAEESSGRLGKERVDLGFPFCSSSRLPCVARELSNPSRQHVQVWQPLPAIGRLRVPGRGRESANTDVCRRLVRAGLLPGRSLYNAQPKHQQSGH